MPTPIQTNLTTLLPTHTSYSLPPQLTSLASSLLVQSHSAAPNLKPDEEIARTFACCQLAVERLQGRLGLEVGKVGPPVGPRVYSKLKRFLEGLLTAGLEGTSGRDGRETRGASTPGSDRRGRVNLVRDSGGWKEREKAVGSAVEESPRGPKRKREVGQKGEVEVPGYVGPLLRELCRELETPDAMPHAFAAVQSILADKGDGAGNDSRVGKRTRRATEKAAENLIGEVNVTALVVALYLATASRMYGWNGEVKSEQEARAVEVTTEYGRSKNKQIVTAGLLAGVEQLEREADTTWPEMEWHQNVPQFEYANDDNAQEGAMEAEVDDVQATPVKRRSKTSKTPLRRREKHHGQNEDPDEPGPAGLLPGLGTMFQPAVDWLSEEKRAGFAAWKEDLLSEMAVLDQSA